MSRIKHSSLVWLNVIGGEGSYLTVTRRVSGFGETDGSSVAAEFGRSAAKGINILRALLTVVAKMSLVVFNAF